MELFQYFKGFIRNYATLLIFDGDSKTKVTAREIAYFSKLGEMLGYHVFQEDTLEIERTKRRGDLFWTKYDPKDEDFSYELHLEHENSLSAEDTIKTKLSDSTNLIAVCWDNLENNAKLVEIAKEKIEKYEDIQNILLILQKKLQNCILVTGIEISRTANNPRVRESHGLVTKNDAGFYYGLLKEEIEESKWIKHTKL